MWLQTYYICFISLWPKAQDTIAMMNLQFPKARLLCTTFCTPALCVAKGGVPVYVLGGLWDITWLDGSQLIFFLGMEARVEAHRQK